LVFNGKVAILSLTKVIGIVIEDGGIAKTVKIMLQTMWGNQNS